MAGFALALELFFLTSYSLSIFSQLWCYGNFNLEGGKAGLLRIYGVLSYGCNDLDDLH